MGRHLSPRYGHVILVSEYPVLTAVNNHNMDVQYQVAGGLQVSQQGRKCDISHWFPCGADGRAVGRTYGHVTTKISCLDR